MLWIALLFISGGAVIGTTVVSKKQKHSAKGESLEKAREEGSKAAKQGAVNAAVDVGFKYVNEGAGKILSDAEETLASDLTKNILAEDKDVYVREYIKVTVTTSDGKQWDGTVTEKHTETRQEKTSADGDDCHSTYTLYIVQIRKENGRVKKLKEKEHNHPYYDYLQVGDRVRYHPQFNYYYEKYDKSRDSYAFCPVCACKNNLSRDTCARCGVPVIK